MDHVNFNFNINQALETDVFRHARVIAGASGLDNEIKWTHIIETKNFGDLINGGELILTTGSGLDLDASFDTYERMIQKNVAGICIEKGTHFTTIPKDVKQYLDAHHFPVIVFERIVKFVDITQKLHGIIINQQHQMLQELNNLSITFNELSLSPNGILKILEELYTHFHNHVFFTSNERKAYYYPPEAKSHKKSINLYIQDNQNAALNGKIVLIDKQKFAIATITVLGQVWGYIFAPIEKNPKNEFLFSVLDRAAASIAQILLRNRTTEERKLNSENELVQNLLLGKPYNPDELNFIFPKAENNVYYRVLVSVADPNDTRSVDEEWEEIKIQKSMAIRSLLTSFHLHPAVSVRKREITTICFFYNDKENHFHDDKFMELAETLSQTMGADFSNMGFSAVHYQISDISTAYKEAQEVHHLNKLMGANTYFYEKTGIYRILFQLKDNQAFMRKFIQDYIGPLITYDYDKHSDLLKTLELYLQFNESKKETAERLFIVRQTLYHRLRKIEELLGDEFIKPPNRLSVEIAIKFHHYLNAL